MQRIIFLLFLVTAAFLYSQETSLGGKVVDARSGEALSGAIVSLGEGEWVVETGRSGSFEFTGVPAGGYILSVEKLGYNGKRLAIVTGDLPLELGMVYLEPDLPSNASAPVITLSEGELDDEAGPDAAYSLLHASRDVFLNRAAFDFSQAFFRIRGYDSGNTEVLLNGLSMNSLFDGRPHWNLWGGLNDVLRNQEINFGLRASDTGFGGLLGNLLIDTRPSGLRPGYRVTGSLTNRTYRGRGMATYVSGFQDSKWQFALSASRRWARKGFVPGTLYDAWSGFASVEFEPDSHSSLSLTALLASGRRGKSAPITEEVASLLGTSYNPYWGYQEGGQRNSRIVLTRQPILQVNYRYKGSRSLLQLGIMYQFGEQSQSRLGYYNAPNPDPVYYRYLPSYAINNPGGANFLNAGIARKALLESPQLNWEAMYRANTNGKAAYLLYEDVTANRLLQARSLANFSLTGTLNMCAGLAYRRLESDNFSRIADLLGAHYHEDIDPFSATRNDLKGGLRKYSGDTFGYSFGLGAEETQAFLQLACSGRNWEAFAAGAFRNTGYRRTGYFLNERYPTASLGRGNEKSFPAASFKGGVLYHRGGRHWWSLNGAVGNRPPLLKYSYVNPRESGELVPDLAKERFMSLELNYEARLPDVLGRISTFYTRIMDMTDIHFFFVDAGLGSDFVQEVSTGIDRLYMGLELGFEYDFTTSLKGSVAGSLGKFLYASDPEVTINFDTAGPEEEQINNLGNVGLGHATLKDTPLATGPQKAFALGLEYRDPGYWWLGITANYLGSNYLSPSMLKYTRSFLLDPETGTPFAEATPEILGPILRRESLGSVYFLDLTAGKSWLKGGKYLSVFASVSNLFDSVAKTGGYEQSRNGNFGQWIEDHLSGSPSFGPKYWYSYGRTFFLNLSLSF